MLWSDQQLNQASSHGSATVVFGDYPATTLTISVEAEAEAASQAGGRRGYKGNATAVIGSSVQQDDVPAGSDPLHVRASNSLTVTKGSDGVWRDGSGNAMGMSVAVAGSAWCDGDDAYPSAFTSAGVTYADPPPSYTLSLSFSGDGTGTVTVTANGASATYSSGTTLTYASGTSVSLSAVPEYKSLFVGFTGALTTSSQSGGAVTMTANQSVDANFQKKAVEDSPPTVSILAPSEAESGTGYTVTANGTDDKSLATITITRSGGNGSITSSTQNVGAKEGTASVTAKDTGPTTVTYTATALDALNQTATATATVTIATPNTPPTIVWTSSPGAVANGASYTVSAKGADADGNLSTVTITRSGSQVASVSGNGAENNASYTTSDSGPATITYTATATDAKNNTTSITQTVTIGSPGQVTAAISASPTAVMEGEAFTVTWSTAEATAVAVSGTDGWSSTATSGSRNVSGLSVGTYTYSITAQGERGPATGSVTVTVAPPNKVSGTISLSPTSATAPGATTVTWSTANASSVSVTGSGLSSTAANGSQSVSGLAAGTYTYTLTAQGPGGPITQTATFTVAAASVVSGTISASPTNVTAPGATTVTWSTANASSVSVTGPGLSSTAANGSQAVSGLAAGTNTYTLTAQGAGGPITQTATVTVAAGSDAWISAVTTIATEPGAVTVSWGTANASSAWLTWGNQMFSDSYFSNALNGSTPFTNMGPGTYTFTLTAQTPSGTITRTASAVIAAKRTRIITINYPGEFPATGGAINLTGTCDMVGSGEIYFFRREEQQVTTNEIVDYDEDGNPIYGDVTRTEWVGSDVYRGPITLTAGNQTFYPGPLPPAPDGKRQLYTVSVAGTDDKKGFSTMDFWQAGLGNQTVSVTPTSPWGNPGDTVTLTAKDIGRSALHPAANNGTDITTVTLSPNYVWSGAVVGSSATMSFTIPVTAKQGDSYKVSVYASEMPGYLRSDTVDVTITCGQMGTNYGWTYGLLVVPKHLPWQGGTVAIDSSETYSGGAHSIGTIRIETPNPFPSPLTTGTIDTVLGGPGHYTPVIPPNWTASPQTTTVTFWSGCGLTLKDTVIVDPDPAFGTSAVPEGFIAAPDILVGVDGKAMSDYAAQLGAISFGSAGTVTAATIVFSDNSSSSLGLISDYNYRYSLQNPTATFPLVANTQAGIRLPLGGLKAPPIANYPIGSYAIYVTITNASGSKLVTGAGKVVAGASVTPSMVVNGPIPTHVQTYTDTDENGDEYTYDVVEDFLPSQDGFSIAPGYVLTTAGSSVTEKVNLWRNWIGQYQFLGWLDNEKRFLGSAYTATIVTKQGPQAMYALFTVGGPYVNVTWSAAPTTFVYSGTAQGPVFTGVAADGSVTFVGNGYKVTSGTATATAVGSYACAITATLPEVTHYVGSGSFTWSITPKPVTFTFGNLTQTYDGTPKSATVTPSDTAATYSVTYTGTGGTAYTTSATFPSAAGTYTVTSAASGNFMGSGTATLTITRPTPVITWATPAPITYGVALSATHLNATANVAGSFVYSPASGAVLPVGSQTLSTLFTPTSITYNTATANVALVVTPAVLTVTADNQTRVYGSSNPTLTVSYSGFVNGETSAALTTPPNVMTTAGTSTPVGMYPILPSGAAAANYTFNYVNGWLTITAKPITFTFGDGSATYDGTAKAVTVTPSDTSATYTVSYAGTAGTSYGPSTAAPVNAGTYAVTATANGNYSGTGSTTLTIAKATPTLTWATPAPITYGTALSVVQLNATANVPGSFIYTPASGAVLGVGSQTLNVGFTPSDSANYNGAFASVQLVVNPAVLTIIADDQTRLFGEANPPLTYRAAGFVNGDTASAITGAPSLTTEANATSAVGSYIIAVGAGTLTSINYTFSYGNGSLLVRRHPVTFTFSNLSHVYDGAMKIATVTPSDPMASYMAAVTVGPDAGSYTVSASGSGGYTGTSTAILVIAPAPQTITISPEQLTVYAGQPASFVAAGGVNAYTWTGASGSAATASATFPTPGTYSVSVTNLASTNYLASNVATATVTVLGNRAVTAFTPVESNYTVEAAESPLNGRSYRRIWEAGGWKAYLGRSGVRFAARAQAWPAVKTIEIQAKAPAGEWTLLASQSPETPAIAADLTFSVKLGESVPDQPLVPLSFQQGTPLTGTWLFRARVQDSLGEWSEFSPEVSVDVVLPITTKTLSGQTVPPSGDLGAWFTASPIKTYSFPLWIP